MARMHTDDQGYKRRTAAVLVALVALVTLPQQATAQMVAVPTDFTVRNTVATSVSAQLTSMATAKPTSGSWGEASCSITSTTPAYTVRCSPPSEPSVSATFTMALITGAGGTRSTVVPKAFTSNTPLVQFKAFVWDPNAGVVSTAVTCTSSTVATAAAGSTPATFSATLPQGATTITCTPSTGTAASFTVTVDSTPPVITVPANIAREATRLRSLGEIVAFTVTATDNGASVPTTCTAPGSLAISSTGGTFTVGITTVTCTAVDAVGNSASRSFTVTITDTTPPTISGVPTNIIAEATSSAGATVTYVLPTASDIVDGAVSVSCSRPPGTAFALGTTTVTCTATDSSSRTATASFSVTVRDTTPPTISGVPSNIVAEATSSAGATVTYISPTATDLVSGAVTVSCSKASGTVFALGDTTVTCTATDAAGKSATASFTVTVRDTTPPTISGVPSNIVAEATSSTGATVTYISPTARDFVSGAVTVSCSKASGTVFALGDTTVTCTATDAAGKSATASFTVTVRDTTPPTISGVPSNIVAEATSSAGATVTYISPTATDFVSGAVTVSCSKASGTVFALGDTTVTCTATDAAGKSATASFKVTVQDTTAPQITKPADLAAVEATSSSGAVVSYTNPTATDNAGVVTVSCIPASGSTFPLGATTVTCTATDGVGKTAVTTFKVTVQDTTRPTITGATSITLEATSPQGATHSYTVSASDLVSPTVSVTCTPTSGSTFAVGTTPVSCSATDGAGNEATATFTVTVEDTTLPVFANVPAAITLEATSSSGAPYDYTPPTATDFEDTSVPVSCVPAPGSTFALGITTTVTCTAVDASSNEATATFTVTVEDTTLPVFANVPAAITLEATSSSGAPYDYTPPTATDFEDTSVPVSCVPAPGSTFALGITTTVTCTAVDASSNEATATFEVTVEDTTLPVFADVPAAITLEATSSSGAPYDYTPPTATDFEDTSVPVSCVPAPGSTFALGITTTVTCTAVDASSNEATATFTVTVEDTTLPVFADVPAAITLEATSSSGAPYDYTPPTATDFEDTSVPVSCVPAPGSTFALGITTTVTCTAVDASSNEATATFEVTVEDTTLPVFANVPAAITLEATSSSGAPYDYTPPTATDFEGTSVPVSCVPAPGSTFALGITTTVTCTAVDASSNEATATFTVTVEDTTLPVFADVPAAITLEATSSSGAPYDYTPPTATDFEDTSVPVSCVPAPGSTFALGITTTVTCTAVDASSNEATATFEVTVEDTTLPVFANVPAAITLEATSSSGAPYDYTPPTATDFEGTSVPVSCVPAPGSTFALGITTTVTCTAVDASSNEATATFKVTVEDTTLPVFADVPAAITLEATSSSGAPYDYTPPTATDFEDTSVPVSCVPAPGSTFALGITTTVTCTAVDASSNEATATFKVTVEDTTLPVFANVPAAITLEATSSSGAPYDYTPPTATDFEDTSVPVSCVPAPGSTFALGITTTVTCTAVDASSNEATATFEVTVEDTTLPVFANVPAAITLEATSSSGAPYDYTPPTATDFEDTSVPVSCVPAPGSTFALGITTTVTCTAVDASSNEATATFEVTVEDTTLPVFADVPAAITLEATSSSGAPYDYTPPTATDFEDTSVPVSCVPAPGSTFALGITTTVTCTAVDASSNEATATFTVTVEDTTLPVFANVPAAITLEATSSSGAPYDYTPPTATDFEDTSVPVSCVPAPGSTFALGITTTVTCTAVDASSNEATATFEVTVEDTTLPVFANVPAAITLEATSSSGAPYDYTPPTATDFEGTSVPVSCVPAPGSTFALGITTTVTCTAVDASSNEATATFEVTVEDTTLPVFADVPAAITLEATSSSGAPYDYTPPTATDFEGTSVPVSCVPAPGSTFALGITTTVTCTAVDASSNEATATFTVTVEDTTLPVFANVPAAITLEATSSSGAPYDYTPPTATDFEDTSVPVSCVPAPGSTFALGITTTVTCTAVDASSNEATATFEVTVEDTTLPVFANVPAAITLEATSSSGAPYDYTPPTATDFEDTSVPVSCVPAPGSTFALGITTTVTCTAVDASSNEATATFEVTVEDTTLPVFADVPAAITLEATSSSGAPYDYTPPTATDFEDTSVPVSCVPAPGSTFALGITTTVTCTAVDASSNEATATFTVTVEDTTLPVFANVPAAITLEATSSSGAPYDYTPPTATDFEDTSVPVSCVPAPGSTFALGITTTVTCTAVDASSNEATATFEVTVEDTTLPVFANVPAAITLEATSSSGAPYDYTPPTATDFEGTSVPVSCVPAPGSTFALGITTTVTCTAVDASSNEATATFTVTVEDTTLPVFADVPAAITLEATSSSGAPYDYTPPTATDFEGTSVPVSCVPAPGSTFALGITTTVTCTAVDVSSNEATATFEVTVEDTTLPVFANVPAAITLEATSSSGAPYDYTPPTATDFEGTSVPVSCVPAPGSTFALGITTTVTCTAVDASSNEATATFEVTVEDTTLPVFANVPAAITLEATSSSGAPYDYTPPTATDFEGTSVPVSCVPAPGSTFALGITTTVTCTAVDASSNEATATFEVTVEDTTLPVFADVPAAITLEATSSSGAPYDYTPPTATDFEGTSVPVSCVPAPGSTFALGITTTVTCTAVDASSNEATATFEVTVEDTTLPVFANVPAAITLEATSSSGAPYDYTPPTATDFEGTSVPVSCVPAPGSTFALGITTTVTCTAVDVSSNEATATFKVTVEDTTLPVFANVPAAITLEATSSSGAPYDYTPPTATDFEDISVPVSCVPAPGSTFALGITTTVTCTAVDASSNEATATFTVTVEDTTLPVFANVPAAITLEATSSSGAPYDYTPPTATDFEGTSVPVLCVPAPGSTFALRITTTVTCTAVDASSNEATATFKVTVEDTTLPVFANVPAAITLEATSSSGAPYDYTPPTATDFEGTSVPVSCVPAPGSTFALGITTTVTCTAVDASSNEATATFEVTVEDTTLPVFADVPAAITLEATSSSGAPYDYTPPTATDFEGTSVPVSCVPAPGSTFALGITTTVTCTAVDASSNEATATFEVTVEDTTLPVFANVPAAITLEATSSSGAPYDYTPPTATDFEGTSVPVSCVPAPGSTFALGITTTVTCTAVDVSSNEATATFKVTVEDTTLPVFANVPAAITLEATSSSGAPYDYTPPTATDFEDISVPVSCVPAPGSTFALGITTTVTCTAVDASSNEATATFTVTVEDTTLPVFANVPAAITLEATSSSGAPYDYTPPTATDFEGTSVPVLCVPAPGSTFALRITTTVTCTAVDASSNEATATFKVTVEDTTLPVFANVPAAITLEATSSSGAPYDYTPPTATDFEGTSVPVSCVPAPGSTFALGITTTVTCTAVDASSNEATVTFTVTITDTTPPTITNVPRLAPVQATSSAGATVTYSLPTASDIVDGAVFVSCSQESGTIFSVGPTAVTCSATDQKGNTATETFQVTVNPAPAPDTTPPVVTVPSSMSVGTASFGTAPVLVDYGTVTAVDAVDGTVPATCSHPTTSPFPIGTTTVTCSATDKAGNMGTASFTVEVVDNTPPQISSVTTPPPAVATSSNGAVVTYTPPTATDNSGTVAVDCKPASGSTFSVGPTTVTCTATDGAGNTATTSFTVTVSPAPDTTPPVVTVPSSMSVGTASFGTAPVLVDYGTVTAVDAVDGTMTATCSPQSKTVFAIGITTVTCSATDKAGNKGTASFTVEVVDNTPPQISSMPTPYPVASTSSTTAVVTYTPPTATDNSGTVAVDCKPASGSTFVVGSTPVTCTASDKAGNTATTSFTVTVNRVPAPDTTPPVVTVPADMTVSTNTATGTKVNYGRVSAVDAVDGAMTATCSPPSNSVFAVGTTTVTCEATDRAGNKGTASFKVTVQLATAVLDTTPPQLKVPTAITVRATKSSGIAVTFDVTATDNVDPPGSISIQCRPSSGSNFKIGVTTVSCTATDRSRNTATATFTVTVLAPSATAVLALSVPTDISVTSTTDTAVSYTVTATDGTDAAVTPVCTPSSGSKFPIGRTTVSCTATGSDGNTASKSFAVIVSKPPSKPPKLSPTADMTVQATSVSGATVAFSVTATDDVGSTVPVTCKPPSGSNFARGKTRVTCDATNSDGLTDSSSFTVTVEDSPAPVLSVPVNIEEAATSSTGTSVSFSVTAADSRGAPVIPVCTPSDSSASITLRGGWFPVGATTVLCSATDAAGKSSSGQFTVTVKDTTAPVLSPVQDVQATATGASGVAVDFAIPSASDLVDGAVIPECTPPKGSLFPVGTTKVVCTARDRAGNQASAEFNVIVAPQVVEPAVISGGNGVCPGFSGYDAPISPSDFNTVNPKQPVALKFSLDSNAATIGSAVLTPIACAGSAAAAGAQPVQLTAQEAIISYVGKQYMLRVLPFSDLPSGTCFSLQISLQSPATCTLPAVQIAVN